LPAVEAIVLRRHEGEEVAMQKRRSVLIKADLEQIGMTETWFGSRQHGAPPHIHRRHVDSFYVLDGEAEFTMGEETLLLGAGSFVSAPVGAVHTFANGPGVSRVLNIHAPSVGFHDWLREIS
jgi:quercetin dioxygenase-like cupin family protein